MEDTASTPWTPWDGGECPVPASQEVTVILREMNGDTPVWRNGAAVTFDWQYSKEDPSADIQCYR